MCGSGLVGWALREEREKRDDFISAEIIPPLPLRGCGNLKSNKEKLIQNQPPLKS
jgi:hypothetical protein